MRWTAQQVARFNEDGYLFLPALFSPEELAVLNAELPGILAQQRPENLREQNFGAVRSALSPHLYNEAFRRLSRHPRLIDPAMQVLGGEVYLHQFKINPKVAHDGEIWHWHQDFRTWHEDDGMPEPHIINAALFLDEVNEFNGPMMFIPGSHQAGWRASTRQFERIADYSRLAADAVGSPYSNETIDALIEAHGLVAPKGPAGSTVFFHACTIHGSAPNMSPWSRTMVLASPNQTDNYIRKPTRPAFLALQDFTPVQPLANDCLLTIPDDANLAATSS